MLIDPVLGSRFPLRSERFRHGDFTVDMLLPLAPEELIDESEFNVDERLPYWADLWPSARGLARFLLDADDLPATAIELGCGVALPSLALRHRGVEVVATDYYLDALHFARRNAELNGLGTLATRELDWRESDGVTGRFPLVVAADVLYEERNVESVAAALPGLTEPGGTFLLADPGRSYLGAFLERMAAAGWEIAPLGHRAEVAVAGGPEIQVQLLRLTRPAVDGGEGIDRGAGPSA